MDDPKFSIDSAFTASVEQVDFEHSLDQLIVRLQQNLDLHSQRKYTVSAHLRRTLQTLTHSIRRFLNQ
jgi:hypothetical protein